MNALCENRGHFYTMTADPPSLETLPKKVKKHPPLNSTQEINLMDIPINLTGAEEPFAVNPLKQRDFEQKNRIPTFYQSVYSVVARIRGQICYASFVLDDRKQVCSTRHRTKSLKTCHRQLFCTAFAFLMFKPSTLTQNKKHPDGCFCFGAASDVKSEPKAEFSISSKVIVSVPSL